MRPVLDRMRTLADRLGELDAATAMAELRAIDERLAGEILPHERIDETELHPRLERMLGGQDPMAPIAARIARSRIWPRRLARLVAELPTRRPRARNVAELRRTLYGLETILRLHFAHEDEIYDSVAAEPLHKAALPG